MSFTASSATRLISVSRRALSLCACSGRPVVRVCADETAVQSYRLLTQVLNNLFLSDLYDTIFFKDMNKVCREVLQDCGLLLFKGRFNLVHVFQLGEVLCSPSQRFVHGPLNILDISCLDKTSEEIVLLIISLSIFPQ